MCIFYSAKVQKLLQKLWAPFLHIIKNAWLSFCSAFSISSHTANQTQSCKQWAGYKNMKSIGILSNAVLCSSSLVCTRLWCFTAQFQERLHCSLAEVFEAIKQIWRLAMPLDSSKAYPKCASSVSDHSQQAQDDDKQSRVINQKRGCNTGAHVAGAVWTCWLKSSSFLKKRKNAFKVPIAHSAWRSKDVRTGKVSASEQPQVQALPAS